MEKSVIAALLCCGLACAPAAAFCFQAAGFRYQISPLLLEAIAIQESGLKAAALNINRNKAGKETSRDYGLMQINSHHIPLLMKLGIIRSAQQLLTDACLNVQTGAWILTRHLRTCGTNWPCLGSYNAGFAHSSKAQRLRYAGSIYQRWRQLKEKTR